MKIAFYSRRLGSAPRTSSLNRVRDRNGDVVGPSPVVGRTTTKWASGSAASAPPLTDRLLPYRTQRRICWARSAAQLRADLRLGARRHYQSSGRSLQLGRGDVRRRTPSTGWSTAVATATCRPTARPDNANRRGRNCLTGRPRRTGDGAADLQGWNLAH